MTQNELTLVFTDRPSRKKSAISRSHAKFDKTGNVLDAKHERVSRGLMTEKVEEVATLFEKALQTSLRKARQVCRMEMYTEQRKN